MTVFDSSMTLGEARDLLRTLVPKGHECPCCRQFAKVYRRKIHSRMAYDLIRIWRTEPDGWFHMPTVLGINGGDTAKLVYWGMMEEESERREDGGRAGWWRLTDDGRAFANNVVRVPKYALIYDGRCIGLRGEPTSIIDALGDKFDYRELMSS